jgi:sugar phosphate isomerase/epimerase
MKRRTLLVSTLLAGARSLLAAAGVPADRLGICTFSCHQQWRAVSEAGKKGPDPASLKFHDPLTFCRYVQRLGAARVQTPLRDTEPAAMRAWAEEAGAGYEGELRLPKSDADLAGFEKEVRRTREAGATVARAVFTGGRRYEIFSSQAEYRAFHEQSRQILARIEPIARKHRLKIAIENHKDHTAAELVGLMRELSSEWIGVLVDTGNNLALLEDPAETIGTLAPFVMSVHLKDMALQAAEDGFLLSEVPLGTGMLDLAGMVRALRKENPAIGIHLEMATRDPLRVPCLTDAYFATFPERRETHLEAAMARVKANPPKGEVPAVAGKELAIVLAEEEANNRHGLAWMWERLAG